jgi:hypothetical protein
MRHHLLIQALLPCKRAHQRIGIVQLLHASVLLWNRENDHLIKKQQTEQTIIKFKKI